MKERTYQDFGWRSFFLIALYAIVLCDCQESPSYSIPNFSKETVRQNFCPLHRMNDEGRIERRNCLNGVELRPVLYPYQLNDEGVIDETNPHVSVEFLDELARRAGFTWRNSFGVAEKPTGNQTWTSVLIWSTYAYDLVGEWYVRSNTRMGHGILFPEGWYDANLIIVKTTNTDNEVNFLNFLSPFTAGLWGLIALTTLFSGFIYHWLDFLDNRTKGRKMDTNLKDSLFIAAWTFTGHTLQKPKSSSTRIVVFSISFLALLIVAAYTANLASFLVTKNLPEEIIMNFNDVVINGLSCCVDKGGPNHEYLVANYPSATIVPVEDTGYGEEIFLALQRGECDVLLTETNTYESNKRSVNNPDCNLEWVGRAVEFREGSFPLGDSIDLCASLVSEILSLHTLEMKLDGTYDLIWEKYWNRSAVNNCDEVVQDDIDEDESINIQNMAGIFVIHLAAMAIAVSWSLFKYCRQSRTRKQRIMNEIRSAVKGRQTLREAATTAFFRGSARQLGQSRRRSTREIEAEVTQSLPPKTQDLENIVEEGNHQANKYDANVSWQLERLRDEIQEREKYLVDLLLEKEESMHAAMREREGSLVQSMHAEMQEHEDSLVESIYAAMQEREDSLVESMQREKHLMQREIHENIQKYEGKMNCKLQELQTSILDGVKSAIKNEICQSSMPPK